MTEYELDADDAGDGGGPATDADAGPGDDPGTVGERLGLTVPDDHVAAFVAEAFEDPELDATWDEAVGEFVPADARDEWRELSMRNRVEEVLAAADGYDDRAVELLDGIPLDREAATADVEAAFDEAMRLRRNADAFRSAIADAHAAGRIDDEGLVAAVEGYGFETDAIAEREDLVEAVTERYGLDFRPYGGTLMDTDEGDGREAEEAW
ncbi:hypothetical protein ACFQMF_02545 [Halorubrum rutilum]|uniref:Uncharacterized protein n=1 Tax=Halorubrum rutilum TaxID=1364933 RepID=A0ABD6AHU7_9EURY|nr:hypothetical protein [Halorubrum rutilum]